MPPKTSVAKEDILTAAFDIIREQGRKGLTARNIARKIGCSTQPVYSCFRNMKLLEEEALERAADYTTKHYLTLNTEGSTFLDMVVGYVRMAIEERQLFNLLYNTGNVNIDMRKNSNPINSTVLIEMMRKSERLNGMDTDLLYELLNDMWIFTHGLAMLIVNSGEQYTESFIRQRIQHIGDLVIDGMLRRQPTVSSDRGVGESSQSRL